jgi:hypothetical protein
MQMFYEFQEQKTLEMSKLSQWYGKWNSTHEEIMGWCLEEIVFPFQIEKLHLKEGKEIGDFAESRDQALYKYAFDEVLANCQQLATKLDLNLLIYWYYSTFVANVLEQFAAIMETSNMLPTEYFKHYQLESETFTNLKLIIENEEVMGINPDSALLTNIKSSAKRLATEWNAAVSQAVRDFEYISFGRT